MLLFNVNRPIRLAYKCLLSYFTVNCVLSNWTEWTKCDKSCAGGTEKRSRTIITAQQAYGKPCTETEQAHQCNHELSDYVDWTDCDKSCEGGKKKRYRTIINQPGEDGKPCDETEQVSSCNTHRCPFQLKYVFMFKLINNPR